MCKKRDFGEKSHINAEKRQLCLHFRFKKVSILKILTINERLKWHPLSESRISKIDFFVFGFRVPNPKTKNIFPADFHGLQNMQFCYILQWNLINNHEIYIYIQMGAHSYLILQRYRRDCWIFIDFTCKIPQKLGSIFPLVLQSSNFSILQIFLLTLFSDVYAIATIKFELISTKFAWVITWQSQQF